MDSLFAALTHEVLLPCGVLNQAGTATERRVTLREMTGEIRAATGRKEMQEDGRKLMDYVLQGCITHIGDAPATLRAINRLLLADRDYLAYQIRKISANEGAKIPAAIFCNRCRERRDLVLDLDALSIYGLPDPDEIDKSQMSVRIIPPVNADGWASYGYQVSDGKLSALMRYPTGEDFSIAVEFAGTTNFKLIEHHILANTLVDISIGESKILGPMPIDRFNSLPGRIIDTLRTAYYANRPGIDMTTKVKCQKCEGESPWEVTATDFFIPEVATAKSGTLKKLSGK